MNQMPDNSHKYVPPDLKKIDSEKFLQPTLLLLVGGLARMGRVCVGGLVLPYLTVSPVPNSCL